MRVTQIELKQVKSLGNYESRALALTGVVDETENDTQAIEKMQKMVEWHLHLPERQIEYDKQKALLNSEDEKVRTYAERYVTKFEEAQAKIQD